MNTTVKLPQTIYNRVIEDSLKRGVHVVPRAFVISEFVKEGYGKPKAEKWVQDLADANNHDLEKNIIRFRKCSSKYRVFGSRR